MAVRIKTALISLVFQEIYEIQASWLMKCQIEIQIVSFIQWYGLSLSNLYILCLPN